MDVGIGRRELARAGESIDRETGMKYTEAGSKVEGIDKRSVELGSRKFAVVEKAREFTLVPWRPVLDRQFGKRVSGIVRGETIFWVIGRQRGPGVS